MTYYDYLPHTLAAFLTGKQNFYPLDVNQKDLFPYTSLRNLEERVSVSQFRGKGFCLKTETLSSKLSWYSDPKTLKDFY